jgi:flavin-binding protein dodecin
MAVAKTLEIISSSTESIEAGIRDGIAKTAATVQSKSNKALWSRKS